MKQKHHSTADEPKTTLHDVIRWRGGQPVSLCVSLAYTPRNAQTVGGLVGGAGAGLAFAAGFELDRDFAGCLVDHLVAEHHRALAIALGGGLLVRLEDVARAAGVSLATVDRVVNRRDGVRAKTVARVEAAVAKLGYRADVAAARLARGQTFRFAFVLPTGSNSFMTNLTEQVQRTAEWLAGQRGFIDILHVDVFDPDVLAGTLEELSPAYQGVAVIALDHPRVRAAIDDLAARGVAVEMFGIALQSQGRARVPRRELEEIAVCSSCQVRGGGRFVRAIAREQRIVAIGLRL